MARKGLIQREKKRQKLEHKYHLIRHSSKNEIRKVTSLSDKWEIYRKLQSPPRNSAPHVFVDVVLRPADRELTIETLDFPRIDFVKWFIHVCCQEQQDQVGKH